VLQRTFRGLQLNWFLTHFPLVLQVPRLPSVVHAAPAVISLCHCPSAPQVDVEQVPVGGAPWQLGCAVLVTHNGLNRDPLQVPEAPLFVVHAVPFGSTRDGTDSSSLKHSQVRTQELMMDECPGHWLAAAG
jgi:hypothetical protein